MEFDGDRKNIQMLCDVLTVLNNNTLIEFKISTTLLG